MKIDSAINLLNNVAWLGTNHHADEICEATKAVNKLLADFKDCKNELCLKCGNYKSDGCEGCRWRNLE